MPVDVSFLEEHLTGQEKNLLNGTRLGITEYGTEECSYLPERFTQMILVTAADLNAVLYEKLSPYGWRRCGKICYRPACPGCRECVPVRIRVADFKPNRAQRRCMKRNRDLRVFRTPMKPSGEEFELYSRYSLLRHKRKKTELTFESYKDFLTESAYDGFTLRYRYPDGRLAGCAWCDFLPDSVSAIYTAFDPETPERSLGVFSILRQIQLCRLLRKHYLQLGFYVKDCRKMEYKTGYSACEYSDLETGWKN